MRARFGLALALTLLAAVPDKAAAAPVPAGAEWTQATLPSSDGVQQDYLAETISVPPETMRDSVSSSFQLPPAQQPPLSGSD